MQPKKFSEYTPITDTDGTEVIPILKNGQNTTVLAENLPVTASTQTALAEKANETDLEAHISDTNNPHNVTKSQVGLDNVDNTADVDKPVSTAQTAAIAEKVGPDSPEFTGTPTAPTAELETDTTQIATTEFVQDALASVSIAPATFTVNGTIKQTQFNARDYGATGNGTTDDTSSLNSALSACGTNGGGAVIIPNGSYLISAPLIIFSNTTLISDPGTTYSLAANSNCNMLIDHSHSVNDLTVPSAMTNIHIIGGTWNRNANAGTNQHLHTIILGGTNVYIENVNINSTAGKYSILIQNAINFIAKNIFVNVSSDGVHVQGPSTRGLIENIHGTAGDDLVALTPNDFGAYSWGNEGNITDVMVNGVYIVNQNVANGVKVLSGSLSSGTVPLTTARIHILNIFGAPGSGFGAPVYIGDDASSTNTELGNLQDILIENINVTLASAGFPAVLIAGSANSLTIPQVIIRNVVVSSNMNEIAVINSAKVTSLIIEGVNGATSTQGLYALVALMGAPASVARLMLSNIDIVQASLTGQIVDARTAGQTLGEVFLNNVYVYRFNWLAFIITSTIFHISNLRLDSNAGGLMDLLGGTGQAVIIAGAGGIVANSTSHTITSPATLKIESPSYPIDITNVQITSSKGDMAYNTNSSASTGIGPVVYNGTAWQAIAIPAATPTTNGIVKQNSFNVRDYGALGNTKTVADAVTTASSAVLTSATAAFTAADIGKVISVGGAAAAGAMLITTIAGFTNATTITLTTAATTAVTGATIYYGTDDTPAINTAMNAVATVGGGEIYLPFGKYAINTTNGIVPISGVSIRGAGTNSTILYPFGNIPAIHKTFTTSIPLTDSRFTNFTIDGINHAGAYNVQMKGFFIQYYKRCVFENLYIKNTGATGLGNDFALDSIHSNIIVEGCGRLGTIGSAGAAGIGVGTSSLFGGSSQWINCITRNNTTYGIFFESQNNAWVTGYSVINHLSEGNNHGIGDSGCDGLQIIGGISRNNLQFGLSIDTGTVGTTAFGKNGKVDGLILYGNNKGVSLIGSAGGYKFHNIRSFSNTICGITISPGNSNTQPDMVISDSEFFLNGDQGINLGSANSQTFQNLAVINNRVFNNGSSGSNTHGVEIHASVTDGVISNNRIFDDQTTQTQTYAIVLYSGNTLGGNLAIKDNDLRANVTGGFLNQGTITDSVACSNNIGSGVGNVTVTAAHTVSPLDNSIFGSGSASYTVTLAAGNALANREITVFNEGTGTITVAATSGTVQTTSLAAGVSQAYVTNGTNWYAK